MVPAPRLLRLLPVWRLFRPLPLWQVFRPLPLPLPVWGLAVCLPACFRLGSAMRTVV